MNLLQLAQRLRLEAGSSGNDLTTVGAAVEWKRIVTWVAQAWEDIQRERPNWMWMRKTATFNTVASQQSYPVASAPLSLTDFASWYADTFRIYHNTQDNERLLPFLDYERFRNTYIYSTTRTTEGYPSVMSIASDKSIVLALIPNDANYTVIGDYYSTPSVLTADTDTPEMPDRFHMAIVYKAMMEYGAYESSPEVYDRGENKYRKMLTELEINQLPRMTVNRAFL